MSIGDLTDRLLADLDDGQRAAIESQRPCWMLRRWRQRVARLTYNTSQLSLTLSGTVTHDVRGGSVGSSVAELAVLKAAALGLSDTAAARRYCGHTLGTVTDKSGQFC